MDELKEKMTNFKEQVRQAADLLTIVSETVSLKRRGTQYWGCCPFHGEKTPSFKVDPARGLFHCFGCGAVGDVITFTAGLGENAIPLRETICKAFEFMGLEFDSEANNCRGVEKIITKEGSKITACVIPTNEEIAICEETVELVKGK